MEKESNRDEQLVKELDDNWNNVYNQNDRSVFQDILSADFIASTSEFDIYRKSDLLIPFKKKRVASFSERSIKVFGNTAITRGRICLEGGDEKIEQRFMRVYSKNANQWKAVAVQVFSVSE